MSILERARKYEDYVISMRRRFHEEPELSGAEFKTLEKIGAELTAMGLEHEEVPNGGIAAFIRGGKAERDAAGRAGRTVLLRADMDALPVEEQQNLNGTRQCFSKIPGAMHACGHDGHTAMLLGAAKILDEMKAELAGDVVLCFERSEETRTPAGARYIWKWLADRGIEPDSCYGTHVFSNLDSGIVGINDGPMMSGISRFDITITGKGGHGSRPDQSNNPIDCFVMIYQRMEALRLLKNDPFKSVTVSVGKLQSGMQINVIPESVSFGGTVRFFDMEESHKFMDAFRETIDGCAKLCGCRIDYDVFEDPFYISTVNDPAMAQFARRVINEDFGDGSARPCEPWMASETFGGYLAMWPGVICLLGVRSEEKGSGAAHHNGKFDLDESALIKGSAAAAVYASRFLAEGGAIADGRKGGKLSLEELLIANRDDEARLEFFGK